MSLKIEADDPQALGPQQGQFFSAGFELQGDAKTGELSLFSPLGNVLAVLNWTPQVAQMRANGDTQKFDSLNRLIQHATGTAIPVDSLFAWLAGNDAPVAGWQTDLSRFADGRIVARRIAPLPAAELRLVLEP